MPESCQQTVAIATLTTTTANIEKSLASQEKTLKEFLTVLRQLAEQNQQIISLQKADERHEKSFENIYPRVGKLEVTAEGAKVRVGFIMAGMATASSTLTMLLAKLIEK